MVTVETKSRSNDNEEARQRLDSSNSAPTETSTHSSKDNEVWESGTVDTAGIEWLRRFTAPLRMTRNKGGSVELPAKRPDRKKAVEALAGDFLVGFSNTFGLPSASINKVPKELSKLKEGAYTPRIIPIGPLHINEEHLQSRVIGDVKAKYAYYLLHRSSCVAEIPDNAFARRDYRLKILDECYEEIENLEERSHKCYAEYVVEELTPERMLVDGFFILELLFRYYLHKYPGEHDGTGEFDTEDSKDDPYIVNMQTRATVQHDLLCLGNQLPYFVLQKLFELTVDKFQKQSHKRSLSEYVLLYLGQKMSPKPVQSTKTNNSTNRATDCCLPGVEECVLSICGDTTEEGDPRATKKREAEHKHSLHVVHDNYLSFDEPKERGSGLPIMLCASELDFAGVKFVAQTGEDISKVEFGKKPRLCGWFRRAEFEIPKLTVDDATEPFLRNLIAFEQCCPDVLNNVTSVAFLMGLLVNTEKDVQVLTKAEIIHNLLGTDQDAADLFNNLCKEVVPGEFPFAQTCREAVEYSKLCWPTNIAHVRRTYFASPWTFIAFCVGFIAFGIGITQFILSFL